MGGWVETYLLVEVCLLIVVVIRVRIVTLFLLLLFPLLLPRSFHGCCESRPVLLPIVLSSSSSSSGRRRRRGVALIARAWRGRDHGLACVACLCGGCAVFGCGCGWVGWVGGWMDARCSQLRLMRVIPFSPPVLPSLRVVPTLLPTATTTPAPRPPPPHPLPPRRVRVHGWAHHQGRWKKRAR